MHVCVLQTELDPFKGGNHLPLLAAARDVRFTIVCNRSKVRAEDLPDNVKVRTLGGRMGSYYYGCADFLFARRVLRQLPPHSPFWKDIDVIHCNQVMGLSLRRLRGVRPLLFLIHHPVTADREVAVAETRGWERLQWRLKYALLVRWQRAMCATADRVATVSATMRGRIAADYGRDPSKISVVPNGVDGAAFQPVPDAECSFDAAAIGSFVHPRKGFRYLLDVYRRLSGAGKRIADVGRRTDEQRRALESIPGVTAFGTVDGARLIDLLRRSRLLLSTSLFEGFGLSLIEALACGHPAFAFSVGAVPEVIGSIDPNLLVPARDAAALASAAGEFLALPAAERVQRGERYREEVLRRFSLSASAMALEALYAEMGGKGPHPPL